MLRPIFVLAIVSAVFAVACRDEPTRASVVSVSASPTAAHATVPPAVAAVRAIYEGYAKNPDGFARAPLLSRFYIDDNRAIDANCAAGEDHRRCRGDRFSCVSQPPKKAGSLVDAVGIGEQPGVSASVRITLKFGQTTTKADVDVVVEDGVWKIDQVRCD